MERDKNRDSCLLANGIVTGYSFSLRLVDYVCIAVLCSHTCNSAAAPAYFTTPLVSQGIE